MASLNINSIQLYLDSATTKAILKNLKTTNSYPVKRAIKVCKEFPKKFQQYNRLFIKK